MKTQRTRNAYLKSKIVLFNPNNFARCRIQPRHSTVFHVSVETCFIALSFALSLPLFASLARQSFGFYRHASIFYLPRGVSIFISFSLSLPLSLSLYHRSLSVLWKIKSSRAIARGGGGGALCSHDDDGFWNDPRHVCEKSKAPRDTYAQIYLRQSGHAYFRRPDGRMRK